MKELAWSLLVEGRSCEASVLGPHRKEDTADPKEDDPFFLEECFFLLQRWVRFLRGRWLTTRA
jgi:hypothetical protein